MLRDWSNSRLVPFDWLDSPRLICVKTSRVFNRNKGWILSGGSNKKSNKLDRNCYCGERIPMNMKLGCVITYFFILFFRFNQALSGLILSVESVSTLFSGLFLSTYGRLGKPGLLRDILGHWTISPYTQFTPPSMVLFSHSNQLSFRFNQH